MSDVREVKPASMANNDEFEIDNAVRSLALVCMIVAGPAIVVTGAIEWAFASGASVKVGEIMESSSDVRHPAVAVTWVSEENRSYAVSVRNVREDDVGRELRFLHHQGRAVEDTAMAKWFFTAAAVFMLVFSATMYACALRRVFSRLLGLIGA